MAHILLVDNDAIVAERIAQMMISAGHACGWVGDTENAMKVLSARRPNLLLLEQDLPGESGTSLLRRLRASAQFYDLPVMMLTSVLGFKEEQIAYYNGAQDYIRKPFSERMLQFRVKQLLESRSSRTGHAHNGLSIVAGGSDRPAMRRI